MKFVTLFRYTEKGVTNFKQTTKRAKDFVKKAEGAGCKVSEFRWTQGRYDGVVLYDAPDPETASALMLSLAALGNVQTETMTAYDAKGMDKVISKAK